MATALEQSFADLCAKHGLLNMGVTYHAGDKPFFGVSMRWPTADGRDCAQGHGKTIAAAPSNSTADMFKQRQATAPSTLADEPLLVEA